MLRHKPPRYIPLVYSLCLLYANGESAGRLKRISAINSIDRWITACKLNERDRSAQLIMPVFKFDVSDLIKDKSLALFNSNSRKAHFSEFTTHMPHPNQILYGTRPQPALCEDIFHPQTEEESRVEYGDEVEEAATWSSSKGKGILASTGHRVATVTKKGKPRRKVRFNLPPDDILSRIGKYGKGNPSKKLIRLITYLDDYEQEESSEGMSLGDLEEAGQPAFIMEKLDRAIMADKLAKEEMNIYIKGPRSALPRTCSCSKCLKENDRCLKQSCTLCTEVQTPPQ